MKWLIKHAENNSNRNISGKFRNKRFNLFLSKISKLNSEENRVLDLGGANYFWNTLTQTHSVNFNPVLLNKEKKDLSGYEAIIGDASELGFLKNKSFDVCFSNSVIEHLPELFLQNKMALEICRVSEFHFVQTPAFIFPVEPHFLFPAFHWLPKWFRVVLVNNFSLGWYKRQSNKEKAKELVDSIRIIKKRELKKMFPDSKIITEYMLFLPKSYIVTNL